MSALVYFGPATIATTSPLAVKMPRAATGQPATNLGTDIAGIGATVIVAVRDDGTTYVLGTPPPRPSNLAQDVLVPGLNGSVWRVTVTDGVGTLGATRVS